MGRGPRGGAIAGVLLLALAAAMTPVVGARLPAPVPAVAGKVLPAGLAAAPDTALCRTLLHIACYQPAQLHRAYDVDPLLKRGLDGHGRTIAIVDALGAPDIVSDLHQFDAAFRLPDPPSLTVIHPVGAPPPFDRRNPEMVLWALETTLDVEWAHAMAPGARILLVVTPVAETEGLAGFPEIVAAERHVVDHHLADVISQSFGSAEPTFPSAQALTALRSVFTAAADRDITVLAASGDTGSTLKLGDAGCCFPVPVVAWPASDPLVTAVGGTRLDLDAAGRRLSPDTVWNDGAAGAGGGGTSMVFERPDYQDRVSRVVGERRDQAAGHRLGLLNDRLYGIARHDDEAIVDIRSGTNAVTLCLRGCDTRTPLLLPVTGYTAAKGYDLASGLGTVDAAELVDALRHDGG